MSNQRENSQLFPLAQIKMPASFRKRAALPTACHFK